MNGSLLDTNVISEYARIKGPNQRVRRWMDNQPETSLYLSVLTIGEIRQGIALLSGNEKRAHLQSWLEEELPVRFGERLLPITREIAELWGSLNAQLRLKGVAATVIDALLAATALQHNLAIVTRNVKHFNSCGAIVVNPWEME